MKAPTYIEVPDLEKFQKISLKELNKIQLENYLILEKIIEKRCHLLFNDISELNSKININPIFRKLLKSSTTGASLISEYINEIHEKSILFNFNNSNEYVENDLSIYNTAFIEEICNHIQYNVKNDETNTFPGWNNLEINKHRINGLIIVDVYIFDGVQTINELATIINNLTDRSKPIDITIFISFTSKNEGKIIKNYTYLKSKLDNKSHNISIVITSKDKIHDRNIYSDYFRIHSGNCFDYYKGNEIKSRTTMDIHGIVNNDTNLNLKLINELKIIVKNGKIIEISEPEPKSQFILGNPRNKLFDYTLS